jgi:5-methylcytosine-specific restriction endonuclease McrA
MRPVNKGARPPDYTPPISLDLTGASATNQAKVNGELGTLVPNVLDCLELGRKIAAVITGNPPKGFAGWKDAYDVVLPKLIDEYKLAAVPLANQLGSYCSYCETHCPGLIEVEHSLCKSHYPTFMLEWDHFLLACGPCNTTKGNKPSRKDVRTWIGRDIQNEDDCRVEIRDNHYIWPDLNNTSYRTLRPALYADINGSGNWTPVAPADSCDDSNRITRTYMATHTVRADIANVGNDIPVAVLVDAAGNQKANDTIDLVGLNRNGAINTTYDRRVMNRTLAWFEVLQAVRPLVRPQPSHNTFVAAWRNAVAIAKFGGFFSVWVTVLRSFNDPFNAGQTLAARFIQDAAAIYPNTDTNFVP